jgi:hypothetical protein
MTGWSKVLQWFNGSVSTSACVGATQELLYGLCKCVSELLRAVFGPKYSPQISSWRILLNVGIVVLLLAG